MYDDAAAVASTRYDNLIVIDTRQSCNDTDVGGMMTVARECFDKRYYHLVCLLGLA